MFTKILLHFKIKTYFHVTVRRLVFTVLFQLYKLLVCDLFPHDLTCMFDLYNRFKTMERTIFLLFLVNGFVLIYSQQAPTETPPTRRGTCMDCLSEIFYGHCARSVLG